MPTDKMTKVLLAAIAFGLFLNASGRAGSWQPRRRRPRS